MTNLIRYPGRSGSCEMDLAGLLLKLNLIKSTDKTRRFRDLLKVNEAECSPPEGASLRPQVPGLVPK